MASLEEIRSGRVEKLERFYKAAVNPYPVSDAGFIAIAEARDKFSALKKRKSLAIAGRIIAMRSHGNSLFCDLSDGKNKFQVYLKSDDCGSESYKFFTETVDIGDFCQFSGRLFLTKKKEKTLLAADWRMLAKSLRPLPEKWHGLQDVEERFRRRYLDLLSNHEIRDRFELRSRLLSELRLFLDKDGFQEVETPILHSLAGGAAANPFKTYYNALEMDIYLRIAPELFLKRLLVGGFNKIYEIGRNFRNEGIDATHNPEFTMLELYESFSRAELHKAFLEKLIRHLAKTLKKSLKIKYQDSEINFSKKFSALTFEEVLSRFALINNYQKIPRSDLNIKAKQFGIDTQDKESKGKIAEKIFAKICRPKIVQPTFVSYYPLEILPLAKASETKPGFADMYQLIVGGLEIAKGFSELNDPLEQRRRFEAGEEMRKAGDEEASRFDQDFLEALEYGMPPAAGLGIGIDRLVMLFTDSSNIREVIFFPTLRPK
ncbi:MAG: lysine--tRNA ligase [Patescibacteria group bacterium]